MKNKELFGILLFTFMLITNNSMIAQNTQIPDKRYNVVKDASLYDLTDNCIDFTNFDEIGTTCTYGGLTGTAPNEYIDPYQTNGYINNGPSQMFSRHTVHTDTSEVDPRTSNMLHTIPAGETKSVRLGNWNDSAQGESITYTYTVPANGNNIIVVRYAEVSEIPYHSEAPEFRMDILDSIGNSVGYGIYGPPNWNDWHYIGEDIDNPTIMWHDWITVGFNLSSFACQTIQIRFTTKDCAWGDHYGYAYFTLSCSNYTETITSSCSSTGAMDANAPDGFNYSWKNDCTGQIVSNAQTFTIEETDNCSYTCTCSCKTNHNHYFFISACNKPMQPESSLSYNLGYSNCQTNISFANTTQAYIMKNGVKTYLPNQAITAQNWSVQTQHQDRSYYNMTSSDTTLGQIVVPQEGDTIQVTLTSWVNDCDDDTTITIYVPAFKTDSVVNASIYQGGYVIVVDTVIYNPGTYTIVRSTPQGCSMTYHIKVTQVTQYTVTANSNDTAMGTVTGSGTYNHGATATLTATPNQGYEFKGWSNGETAATLFLTVESDTVVTAIFAAESTPVENVEEIEYVVYAEGNQIVVDGATEVFIYDASGKTIFNGKTESEMQRFAVPAAGIYFMRVDNRKNYRIVVR